MDFSQAVVVITGAGSGIGKQLALKFAQQGAQLAINDKVPEALSQTHEEIEQLGGTVYSRAFDVGCWEEMQSFAEKTREEYGRTDVLVNNAGVALGQINLEDVAYTDFEWIVNVNMWGVIHGTMAFLPMLRERPEARLVNVCSSFGLLAVPGQAPYCATKFAVRGFTDSVRLELMDTNVCVTLVCPSQVKTGIIRNGRHKNEDARAELIKKFDEQMTKMSAEEAAQIILQAVRRKLEQVEIGKDARIFSLVSRFVPRFMIKALVRRELKKLAEL